MMADAGQKKRWEPKEPERFLTDEMGRDAALSLAARFAWDKAWQPERRAKGYVPVKPAEPEQPPQEDDVKPGPALSGEEAIAAAWADEVEEPVEAAAGQDAGGEAEPEAPEHEDEPETQNADEADADERGHEDVR